jgi:D-3-phosphoglycerate dehydrogenase
MKKIALYGVFNPVVKEMFRKKLPKYFEIVEVDSPDEFYKIKDVEYMVTRSFEIDEKVFNHAPRLVLLQKWGAGYDKIDIKAAGKRGVSVAICLGSNTMPVAELAVLHMLAVYRNLIPLSNKIKENNWARDEYAKKSFMINRKVVGLVGLGNIGQRVGMIVKRGFGAEVQYYDLNRMPEEKEIALGFKFVDLDTLLRTSDIISVHVPLFDSTRNLINSESFNKMKPSAIIINTSRGGVINEAALIEALRNKVIAGAGLDTFTNEPLDAASPLLQFENLVATPHCGGNTADNDINMVSCCVENILKYDSGGGLQPPVLVNQDFLVR